MNFIKSEVLQISCHAFLIKHETCTVTLNFYLCVNLIFSTEKSTTTTGIGNIENINKNKDDKLSVTSSSAVPSSNGSGSKQSSSSMGKRRKGHKNSKKSSNPVPEHHSINYKNLDEWLESTIKGMNVGDNNSPAASASNIHQHPHLMNTNPFYPNMLPPYTGMRPWSDMVCNHLSYFR